MPTWHVTMAHMVPVGSAGGGDGSLPGTIFRPMLIGRSGVRRRFNSGSALAGPFPNLLKRIKSGYCALVSQRV
jgi:hypothetical protein